MQEEAGSLNSMNAEQSDTPKSTKKNHEVKIPTVAQVVEKETALEAENAVSGEPAASESEDDVRKRQSSGEISMEDNPEIQHQFEYGEPEKTEQTNGSRYYSDEDFDSDDDLTDEEREAKREEERLRERRSNLNLDNETALLETVLFLESEPQTVENLARITQMAEDVIKECINRLKEKYTSTDSGIEISQIIGGWMLTPKKDCFDLVKERYGKRNEGRLSKAAIETLSIIAYSQPITRAEIESIRHVNADNMMRILLDRKFIKEAGKKDVPGKPTMYRTTDEFLEFFHLQSINDLPKLDDKESQRFELAR